MVRAFQFGTRPMCRLLFPLVIGLFGAVGLVALGTWQVQRLTWKAAVLADITARISAAPVDLPVAPDQERNTYLPVQVAGKFTGEELHVLVSVKVRGAGYRIISAFESGDRRIMIDRGYVPLAAKDATRAATEARVIGNLHWPDEIDGFTPDPELSAAIWFARDVGAMAEALDTEPVLVIVRSQSPEDHSVTPLPVNTSGIPNDHLGYAITWFSLAIVWLAMTGFWLWRQRASGG